MHLYREPHQHSGAYAFIQLCVTISILGPSALIRWRERERPAENLQPVQTRPADRAWEIKYILSLGFNDNCRMVFSSLTINSIRTTVSLTAIFLFVVVCSFFVGMLVSCPLFAVARYLPRRCTATRGHSMYCLIVRAAPQPKFMLLRPRCLRGEPCVFRGWWCFFFGVRVCVCLFRKQRNAKSVALQWLQWLRLCAY